MGPKLRQLTDAIAEVVAADGFSLGPTSRDTIPFMKEEQEIRFIYFFDVLAKNALQVEARIKVCHHQTEELYHSILPPPANPSPEASLWRATLYACVGRIVVWKQPFWHLIKDPLAARTPLYDAKDMARAIEKQKKLYLNYVRDAFAEVSSFSAIEQHLNGDISKPVLYAENRYHRAARGIVTAKIAGRSDLPELITAYRAMLVKHKYNDKLDEYDRLAAGLSSTPR